MQTREVDVAIIGAGTADIAELDQCRTWGECLALGRGMSLFKFTVPEINLPRGPIPL
jgi:hypothetical protein